ncbi:MAG: bifunctional folylpolyglutamate synthase/dihydrofolate synthase [Candidatus Binatia bacterium]|nr:MAG: bifunctional folylpolyglutamate synthase/dihydrofolate synthase [Candidatus Binatia bacterium]
MTRYESLLRWLYELEAAKGMDFKLERVELALREFGNPHRRYPAIHIAGTNGKGSTAALAHAMLGCAGYRSGLYTSPHLVRFTERIRVGEAEIAEDEVVELAGEIQARAVSRGIALTFFEFTTVLAFAYFARKEVDVAVVEVGLGGRLDATNVVEGRVAVVTTIGLDHEEYLGHTVLDIAREKGGIVKHGANVVLGNVGSPAREYLVGLARERSCPVYRFGEEYGVEAGEGRTFLYRGPRGRLPGLELALQGSYQRENAATAIAALDVFPGLRVPESAVREGLLRVSWPGRLQTIEKNGVLVVLDGAHNPQAALALAREFESLFPARRARLLFAVMKDKRWHEMAAALAPLVEEVVVTRVLPPRGESPEVLARAFAEWKPTRISEDPSQGLRDLLARSRPGEVVLVTGSLFLIGAVLPFLCGESAVLPAVDAV